MAAHDLAVKRPSWRMKFCSAAIVLAMSVLSAGAQQTNAPAPDVAPIILPPVTVKGSAGGSLTSPPMAEAEKRKREVPGGYTVQGPDAMDLGRASSMGDFFQDAPGLVMLSENNVETSKVFIRGSGIFSEDEPAGVQYLIDGLTLNQADGEIILEDFDAGTIQYAEVYRGADALQYGALGLGGAVNFVPFTGYDAAPLAVRVEGGSFGFTRDQISSGGVSGPWDYYVSVSGRNRDGWRRHSQESTETLFSDIGYKFSPRLENRFYIIFDNTDRQLPGALTLEQMQQDPAQAQVPAVAQNWSKDWDYLRLADKVSYQAGAEEASAGAYWWHRNAYEPNLFVPDEDLEGIEAFYSDNFGALLNSTTRGEWLGGENVVTVGFNPATEKEVDSYYENLNGVKGNATGIDVEWSLNAVGYAQWQHYFTEKLSLVAGVQAALAQRHFYDRFTNSADGDQSGDFAHRSVNPKIGLMYELTGKDQVFANFSKSWQPPSFDDTVEFDDGPGTSQVLTPLMPQRAWTAEAGARGEDGRFEWELALYHSWVRDELLDLNNAQDVDLGGVNVARSTHQGIEAGLDTRLWSAIFTKADKTHGGDQVTLRQDYTLTDLHFDHDPVYGDNVIAGAPIHLYEAELRYESSRGFYAGPNVQWVITPYPVDNANTLYAPSYALLGFRAGMELGKGFSIFFDARNLLNERYASSVDPISSQAAFAPPIQVFHPGDPRSFYGGVAWKW